MTGCDELAFDCSLLTDWVIRVTGAGAAACDRVTREGPGVAARIGTGAGLVAGHGKPGFGAEEAADAPPGDSDIGASAIGAVDALVEGAKGATYSKRSVIR